MKVSINWAQHFSNVDLKSIPTDQLLLKIGAQLGAVEEVTVWGPRYDGIIVAKIVSCVKHPDADRLNLCVIDDGGANKNVTRDEQGHIQVVCGAPNAREGLTVAWIPPGVVVPATLDKDPLTLEAREIRGHVSNGMLASPSELGISDDHEGILEIESADVGEELTKLGTPFKHLYGMDDVVIDCENKMFTHRPDCFGILGVARELAGITGQAFKSPDWYLAAPQPVTAGQPLLPLDAVVETPDLVSRLMVTAIAGVTVAPSPLWMQAGLTRVGIRPINNIVDITNFVMQLTGQPLHAYDYDKLKARSSGVPTLIARASKQGEKVHLLNGKTLELQDDSSITIATDKEVVGIGGVMGGADTEVDATTKNIVLEAATFDMYNIRRTAMKYGLFTDAVTRFTKGQSPLQNDRILAYAIQQILELAGGSLAGEVKDVHGDLSTPKTVTVDIDFINHRLGSSLTAPDAATLLTNVEMQVNVQGNKLEITAPFWRTDIELPEDVVEEIGRLYGFDKLPVTLPSRTINPVPKNALLTTTSDIRKVLAKAGANEVLTYSFVHGDLLTRVGQDPNEAYKLSNALSPDLQYYRVSLLPSLLDKVYANIRAGYDQFALFEINPVHVKSFTEPETKLPIEESRLALVFAADSKRAASSYHGAPYFQAKKYLEQLLRSFGITPVFESAANYQPKLPVSQQAFALFEPSRTAIVKTLDGQFLAELGEFKASVRRNLKLPSYVAGFELDVAQLAKIGKQVSYHPLPRFPGLQQDICLKVANTVSYQQLHDVLSESLVDSMPAPSRLSVQPVDVYQKPDDLAHKQITYRVDVANYDRTLTTKEVAGALDIAATAAAQKLQTERV